MRHQRDELAPGRQVGEIRDLDAGVADPALELAHLLVRPREELLEQAELIHHLQRRRMNGVAAKVAQEIAVLLEHHDLDAGARQEQAEHHPGRPAAGNGAGGLNGRRHRGNVGRRMANGDRSE